MNNRRKWSVLSPWRWRIWLILFLAALIGFTVLVTVDWVRQDLKVLEPVTAQVWTVSAPQEAKAAAASVREDRETAVLMQAREASRGADRCVVMECTAYTLRPEECGKDPSDPGYGVTASGAKVEPWQTVAACGSISFGTRIYVPFFADKPNRGVFVVQDRGGAITEGCLDFYMEDYEAAIAFGRRDLEVYVLGVE